jgi:hypothetical protein
MVVGRLRIGSSAQNPAAMMSTAQHLLGPNSAKARVNYSTVKLTI